MMSCKGERKTIGLVNQNVYVLTQQEDFPQGIEK